MLLSGSKIRFPVPRGSQNSCKKEPICSGRFRRSKRCVLAGYGLANRDLYPLYCCRTRRERANTDASELQMSKFGKDAKTALHDFRRKASSGLCGTAVTDGRDGGRRPTRRPTHGTGPGSRCYNYFCKRPVKNIPARFPRVPDPVGMSDGWRG